MTYTGTEVSYALTQEELECAKGIAVKRQEAAVRKRRPSAHNYDERNAIEIHTIGAIAEYAVAKLLKLHWNAYLEDLNKGGRNPPDVGTDIQVRGTRYQRGRLIVHDSDSSDERFILAIVDGHRVRLAGWIQGSDAKNKRFWCDPASNNRPAYFVPAANLKSMADWEN